jgi:hypothetical protein
MLKKIGIGLAVVGTAAAAVGAYLRFIRPLYRGWGATGEDIARAMPGDDIVEHPDRVETFAITIQARPADIWPWLVQIGYKRGGMYSYTWLEKLMGVPMSNADRILPEFQELKVGDVIAYGPQGPYLPVLEVLPNRVLMLGGYDPVKGGGTTTFALDELDQEHTRLIMRGRTHWPNWTLRGILSKPPSGQRLRDLLMYLFFEPGQFIMMRKMLLGIKQRAERASRQTPEPAGATARSEPRQNEPVPLSSQ